MQLSRVSGCCSQHQHRRPEETHREGRRESVSVCVCACDREKGGVDLRSPKTPPSLFVLRCSSFLKQVLLVTPLSVYMPRAVWVPHCLSERVHHREGGLGTATHSLHISITFILVNSALWCLAWYGMSRIHTQREIQGLKKKKYKKRGRKRWGRAELAACPVWEREWGVREVYASREEGNCVCVWVRMSIPVCMCMLVA